VSCDAERLLLLYSRKYQTDNPLVLDNFVGAALRGHPLAAEIVIGHRGAATEGHPYKKTTYGAAFSERVDPD
jgi:hypothetical protein